MAEVVEESVPQDIDEDGFQDSPVLDDTEIDEHVTNPIDKFHCNFLLSVFTEELWVWILEDDFNLHPDSQDDHRHVESHEDALTCILRL